MHISGEIQRDRLMLGLSLPHYLVLFMGGTTPGGRSELLSCFLQLILNFLAPDHVTDARCLQRVDPSIPTIYLCLSACLFIISICLPTYLIIYLFVCFLFVCLLVCLFAWLFVCLSIYPSNLILSCII